MYREKLIYQKRRIDLPATLSQLDVNQFVDIPFSRDWKVSAIRMAVTRFIQKVDGPKFTVTETVNFTRITRTA